MRKVLLGGVMGGLPGFLLALVPLLLHDLGVITSDQSQIGFMGIPLLFLGIIFGTLAAASNTPYAPKVRFGVGAGLVVGIAGGGAIDAVMSAVGLTIAGIWFFLTPVAMIGGGVLGAWWGEPGRRSGRAASQH